jgi:hypothetical protein
VKHKNDLRFIRLIALSLLCVIIFALCGCALGADENGERIVYSDCAADILYPEVISSVLPSYSVERQAEYMIQVFLKSGITVEAYDVQAFSSISAGIAKYWYPHYIATVIIAIDRDRTNAQIKTWNDLLNAHEPVSFSSSMKWEILMPAISYGLEGDGYTLRKATELLAAVNDNNQSFDDQSEPPIVICFDYQAAALIKNGRNIEIVVPSEGTLTFEKGLLGNEELSFIGDVDLQLLAAGLRLPDGRADRELYPDQAAYSSAQLVADIGHLCTVAMDAVRVMRRDVLHVRLYSSKDGREHLFFALLYIILVVVWISSVIWRALHKGVKLSALLVGLILLGWIIVRLLKWQMPFDDTLNRYLWYSFYLFQLALPVVILWLASIIDKPDENITAPKWMRAVAITNAFIFIMVFTNEFHQLTFPFDLRTNWTYEYGYGVGFYLLLAGSVLQVIAAIIMLIVKAKGYIRKTGALFPLGLIILLAAYGYGYANRIPIAWESDITMTIGLFTLLFAESILRTGIVPVNSKYRTLFTYSTLGIQVIDSERKTTISSVAAPHFAQETVEQALASSPLPAQADENTLLFAAPITGGYALWQEDITAVNRLHKDIAESVQKIRNANIVLAEEEKIKRAVDEENARLQLMAQLESEIERHTIKLSTMIEHYENVADRPRAMARITIQLCYVKRRCNLFFIEQEAKALHADELTVYMDELAEIAKLAGVESIFTSELKTLLAIRRTTLLYDFFFNVLFWATWLGSPRIIVHLGTENNNTILRILPSDDANSFQMDKNLEYAINSAGGIFMLKDLDDATGMSLSFPDGGEYRD